MLRLTSPGTLTRTFAIQILQGQIAPTEREADLATSEHMALMDLALEFGLTDDALLATLTSRQYTRYRARAVVRAAQNYVTRYYTASR